jgi:hypothetical protein
VTASLHDLMASRKGQPLPRVPMLAEGVEDAMSSGETRRLQWALDHLSGELSHVLWLLDAPLGKGESWQSRMGSAALVIEDAISEVRAAALVARRHR